MRHSLHGTICHCSRLLLIGVIAFLGAADNSRAEDRMQGLIPDVNYSGDIFDRSTLSGDWNGARNDLSTRGIQIDNYITQVTQNVVDGGYDGEAFSRFFPDHHDTATHMSWDSVLQLDTGKLDLWPGGLFKFRGEGRTGDGVIGRAGTISPVDADMLFPMDNYRDSSYDLTEASYTQFLSPYLGGTVGILNTLDGDSIDFAGSTRTDGQFFNSSFRLNPILTKTAPYKSAGAGLIVLPTKDMNDMLVTATFLHTEDSSGTNPLTNDRGTTFNLEIDKAHTIAGLPGKQNFGYIYADASFRNLSDPRLIFGERDQSDKERSYGAYYSFHQYLVTDCETKEKTTGMGIFGRFGYADGNPNPVDFAYIFGFGGNAPWRSVDTFGIGFYYTDISEEALVERASINDEKGIEFWYNIEVVPWLHVTPDLQIIDSGLPGSDTSYVAGIRTHWNL